MIYPKFLKQGDKIGIPAPSNGNYIDDAERYNLCKQKLNKLGYKIVESKNNSVFDKFVSASAVERAEEFMQMWEREDIDALISLAGGEFMMEILPYLNEERLKKSSPKLFVGFSDNTILCHTLLTWLDTASVYHYTVKYFAQKKWHKSVKDGFDFITGKKTKFDSYNKFQNERYKTALPDAGFALEEKVVWKNAKKEKEIFMQGRMVGGCIDVLLMFLGTKYDKTNAFIEKYKNDGFIWFLESCDLSVTEMKRAMWQLKENGWFKYVNGFIFGRPRINEPLNNLDYEDAIMQIIKDYNVPVVFDADFGHKPPAIPIMVGAHANIKSKNGKGELEFKLN